MFNSVLISLIVFYSVEYISIISTSINSLCKSYPLFKCINKCMFKAEIAIIQVYRYLYISYEKFRINVV